MPRYVVVESEEEQEIKTGRKTRAALAAPADSPMRRSTRIRHGSLNPDGSSPESVNGTSASTQVTRVTRRRVAAATGDSLSTVPEPAPRVLRSRKNSASSNVSENLDIDSAPGTPRGRSNKRLSTVDPSPSTPKPAAKTKRSARAASETSSPAPVVRITRRTRATSIEPEPIAPKAAAVSSLATTTAVSTPTRRRRTQVSVLPTEPVVTEEEINEDKNEESNVDEVVELSDELENSTTTPDDKSSKSLRKSLSSKAKKSSKGNSAKELKDAKVDIDESFAEKLSEDSSTAEVSLRENKSGTENTEEPEAQKCTPKNHTEDSTTNDFNSEENISPKISQGLGTRAKRYSSDKSKELGMKIEDLLNKSTEEQEKSPGNKENEKLNVSPVKIRKNLEFNVSNVNVVRGKSLGSSKFSNKCSDKKLNTSLDEQILSKSRHAYVAIRAINVVDKKRAYQSPDKKSSQVESSDVVESLEQNQEMEDESTENGDNLFKTKTGYTKVDEIVVENEVIEEFSLHDSDDSLDGSKNEFRLTVEGDTEIDKTNASKIIDGNDSNERENCLNAESEMENKEDMFDPEQPADNARKFESENKEEMETDSRVEEPEIENKSEDPEIQKNIDPDQNDEEEPMDTYEHEEPKADENASKVSPEKKSINKPNDQESKIATNDQVSDSDSYMEFDNLFQNISAEEWNKNNSRKKRQSKGKASSRYSSEPFEETNHENDSDSDATVILQANDLVHNKKKNSSVKMIVEAESDDTEIYETKEQRGSPNKSIKSNKSIQNDKEETKNRKSSSKSEEEIMEINDEEIDQECLSTQDLNSTKEEIEEQEEDRPESKKNTPRNKKQESSAKSSAKSNKSLNIQELDDSSENEEASDNEEEKTSIDLTGKTPKKLRSQLNRNYSTVAVVDSDSGPENVTDPDCPSSDDSKNGLPGYLFNVESSGNEEGNSDEEEEENCSRNTIDSDIAKEMNLAGDDDVQYSDDNVLADDCRDSESEHSDENDAGSDLAEFVVPNDEVESSEYSDEEDQQVPRFKRIINKSSSEDDEEIEENKKSEDSETKKSKKKLKRNSKSADNTLHEPSEDDQSDDKLPEFEKKKLDFSFDSERSLSVKKTNKGKIVQDLDDTEISISPSVEQDEPNDKKLKRLGKPVICLLDSTINLCTPEQSTVPQTKDETAEKSPGLNNSLSKKSLKKLRKSLARDLTISTPGNGITVIETEEEEELLATPKDVETPNKEKKTPKSGKKNKRDSMQLIEENCLAKPSISDLNRTMTTPNSDTPVTKFLKKERLNQSLPLIELKKRSSKMFDKRELGEMKEDELEEETEEISEMEKQKEIAEDSDNEGNEENDDVEEEDDKEPDANGHQDEAEKDEDGTDDGENSEEEDEDKDGSNEIDDENENENEEAEESGKEEIVVEKKRSSSGRKSLTKSKEEDSTAVVTPNENQKRASTGSLLNGANEKAESLSKKRNDLPNGSASKKKRTRLELESSETPKGLKQIKKIKIAANNSPAKDKDSDSDEAPESLGFGEARSDALQTMKEVAASVKAGKEAKKKKRREQLERIRSEKEAKAVKKTNLKRLPDDVLENISEVSDRPKKKRKLIKEKTQQVLPSRYMFSPGKSNDNSWKIENCDSPLSAGIGTTQFSVISLEKVKKVPKKAATAASFRDQMLARNPRQPVSAFLMHQAKLKASGKSLSSRK